MLHPKAIVILGAGIMQIPLMFAIKKHRYAVIACDINVYAVGKVYCDEFWNIDISNTNAIIEKIHNSSFSVHAILTAATDFSYAVAKIAKECMLPNLSPEVARNFVFKDTMRKMLQNAGILVPQFKVLPEDTIKQKTYVSIANTLGYPVIIKPIHNMGARGVQKVHTDEQLHIAVEHALMFSKKNSVIIETNLEGPELSIDSFLYNDNLYILGIADRHVYFSPYCVELGHSMPSSLPKEMIQAAYKEIKKAVVVLGMKEGICKADIIFHKGKPYIGELAARLSGGYMSGWTSAHYFRENITHFAVSVVLRKEMSVKMRKIHKKVFFKKITKSTVTNSVGERALISLPGKIVALRSNAHIDRCIRESSNFSHNHFYTYTYKQYYYCPFNNDYNKGRVFAIYLHKRIGNISYLPKNNTQKTAAILIEARDVSSINYTAAHTISNIFVDIKINQQANEFLYSLQSKHQQSGWRCFPFDTTVRNLEQNNTTNATLSVIEKKNILQFLYTMVRNKMFMITIMNKESFISYAKKQFGSWTFCSLHDALKIALEKKLLCINYGIDKNISQEMCIFQQCIWRSFLRAGWQGLYYTKKLIQQCPQDIINYL